MKTFIALVVSAAATPADFAGRYNGGGNGYNSHSSGDDSDGNTSPGLTFNGRDLSSYHTKLVAHAALATLAFAFLFPVGGILMRLGNFRGLWLVHGIFQLFAYFLYIVAFGLGIYLVRSSPRVSIHHAHPIIGIILLVLVFFQPFLGFMHHILFKKYNRRTFWSYAHLWLGRIAITLGIINGGLGLDLARGYRLAPPSEGAMIGYGVAAGIMWLLYVIAVIIGVRRRSRARKAAGPTTATQKEYTSSKSSSSSGAREQYA